MKNDNFDCLELAFELDELLGKELAVDYAEDDVHSALVQVATLADMLLNDFYGEDFIMPMLRDAVAEWLAALKKRNDAIAELKAFKSNYWDSKG